MIERLDCGNCELSVRESTMCGVVAGRTVRRMVRLGYDVSSDMNSEAETVATIMRNDSSVVRAAFEECDIQLAQHEATSKGYSQVV